MQNPDDGVYINFAINDVEAAGDMTLEILDGAGDVVRTYVTNDEDSDFDSFEVKEGMNLFVWDYSAEPVKSLEGFFTYATFSPSYLLPPGDYSVRLSYGEDESQSQGFTVSDDPRSPIPGFMEGQHGEVVLDIYKRIYELHENIADLQLVQSQIKEVLDLPDDVNIPSAVIEAGEGVNEAIDDWIAGLINKERTGFQDALNWGDKYLDLLHWTYLTFQSDIPPLSQNSYADYQDMLTEWDGIIAERDRILAEDVANFNTLYSESAIPAVVLPGDLPEEEETEEETNDNEETEESEDQS